MASCYARWNFILFQLVKQPKNSRFLYFLATKSNMGRGKIFSIRITSFPQFDSFLGKNFKIIIIEGGMSHISTVLTSLFSDLPPPIP